MRIQNLKSMAFDCINFEPDFFEVKPRASCHPTDCHSVDVWPCAAPTPTPAMRVLALINGPYFLPAENSQREALPRGVERMGMSQEIGNKPN